VSEKLEACPFCGKPWINNAVGYDPIQGEYHSCLCNTCGAEGQRFFVHQYVCKSADEAKALAVAAWNRRATQDRYATALEVFEEYRQFCWGNFNNPSFAAWLSVRQKSLAANREPRKDTPETETKHDCGNCGTKNCSTEMAHRICIEGGYYRWEPRKDGDA
jgi:Lar family restriction alleviation protein